MTSTVPRYSNAKHWCALCRTFIQNDPKSIRAHEEGLRHLGVVKRKLNLAARAKDLATSSSSSNAAAFQKRRVKEEDEKEELEPIEVRPDEVLGQYSVRGVVYLQGEFHEDLLTLPSSTVQLSLVDEEGNPGAWIPCKVQRYDLEEKGYEVRFKQEDEDEEMSVHVEPRDLRIVGPPPPAAISNWVQVQPSAGEANEAREEETTETVDESNGKDAGPAVEFHKGVAIVADEDNPALLERKVDNTSSDEKKSVVFRKRVRPTTGN